MKHWCQGSVLVATLIAVLVAGCVSNKPTVQHEAQPLLLIVMDPLAKELACACVKGYGQRDYRKLAAHLGAKLQQRVAIELSDDLEESLKLVSPDVANRGLYGKAVPEASVPPRIAALR